MRPAGGAAGTVPQDAAVILQVQARREGAGMQLLQKVLTEFPGAEAGRRVQMAAHAHIDEGAAPGGRQVVNPVDPRIRIVGAADDDGGKRQPGTRNGGEAGELQRGADALDVARRRSAPRGERR